MSLARLFLDLGGVEQGSDDGCRADTDREAGLDELGAPGLVGVLAVLGVVVAATGFARSAVREGEMS